MKNEVGETKYKISGLVLQLPEPALIAGVLCSHVSNNNLTDEIAEKLLATGAPYYCNAIKKDGEIKEAEVRYEIPNIREIANARVKDAWKIECERRRKENEPKISYRQFESQLIKQNEAEIKRIWDSTNSRTVSFFKSGNSGLDVAYRQTLSEALETRNSEESLALTRSKIRALIKDFKEFEEFIGISLKNSFSDFVKKYKKKDVQFIPKRVGAVKKLSKWLSHEYNIKRSLKLREEPKAKPETEPVPESGLSDIPTLKKELHSKGAEKLYDRIEDYLTKEHFNTKLIKINNGLWEVIPGENDTEKETIAAHITQKVILRAFPKDHHEYFPLWNMAKNSFFQYTTGVRSFGNRINAKTEPKIEKIIDGISTI